MDRNRIFRSSEEGAGVIEEGFPFQIGDEDPPEPVLKEDPPPAPGLTRDDIKAAFRDALEEANGKQDPEPQAEDPPDYSDFYGDPAAFAQKVAEQTERRIMGQIAPLLQQNTMWMQEQQLRSGVPQEAQQHLDQIIEEYRPFISNGMNDQAKQLFKDAAEGRAARASRVPQGGEPVGGGRGEVRLTTGITPEDVQGLESMLGRKLTRDELKQRGYIR